MNISSSLTKTESSERYMVILHSLESMISSFYKNHPELYDYDVSLVYEALLKHIKAKLTNFPVPAPKLEGISRQIFDKQLLILEKMESSYTLKEIQECLKKLDKSLKFWNKDYGSRGYLNFIVKFV